MCSSQIVSFLTRCRHLLTRVALFDLVMSTLFYKIKQMFIDTEIGHTKLLLNA
jgi:hypothetical protein